MQRKSPPALVDRGRDGRSQGPIAPTRPCPSGRALARTPLGGGTPGSNPAYWIPDQGKSGASGNYPAYWISKMAAPRLAWRGGVRVNTHSA